MFYKIYKNVREFGGWEFWIKLWFRIKSLYLNIVFGIGEFEIKVNVGNIWI